eukprot:gene7759-9098_t
MDGTTNELIQTDKATGANTPTTTTVGPTNTSPLASSLQNTLAQLEPRIDIQLAPGANTSTDDLIDSWRRAGSAPVSPMLMGASGVPQAGARASGDRHHHRYRHFIENRMLSSSVREDALSRDLVYFPDDDLRISVTEQMHRTRESVTGPLSEQNQIRHPHIAASLDSFAAPRRAIIKGYGRFKKEPERMVPFDDDKYDCDERDPVETNKKHHSGGYALHGDNHVECDELDLSSLRSYDGVATDRENSAARKKGRAGFFRYFRPDYNWGSGMEVSICNRVQQDIWVRQPYTNVLLELRGLVFMLGDLEPFFCSLSLYDAANKVRLSETFHFDFNSEMLRGLLVKHSEPADNVTQSKHVILSLPVRQQSDIWIVVRIDKVMQGDPEVVKEPYVKLEEKDVKGIKKNKAKVSEAVAKFCDRLGRFTQPFCFAAVPLTSESGEVRHGVVETDALLKVVPSETTDIDDVIADMKDPARRRKLKLIPGTLSLNIVKPSTSLPTHSLRLDPSLSTVISDEPLNTRLPSSSVLVTPPTQSPEMSRPSLARAATMMTIIPVIREIATFPLKDDAHPHHAYTNNLYIYPDTINLSKAHGRNVCIRIEIRDSDILSTPPLRVIYGRSSSQRLTNSYHTQTHYHNKTPTFTDEIKIQLPTNLSPKFHVLFSVYHIVCNKKKEEEDSSLIGYSVLPLYKDRKFVDNGAHNLPLALGAPKDNYLRGDDSDHSFLEGGKSVFKFNLVLKSSLYPQNTHLNRFFLNSQDPALSDNELDQVIDFVHVDALEAIKFLPVIIRQLIYVICNREATVGKNAFKALFIMLEKIQKHTDDSTLRVPLLVSFIAHVFDNPKDTKVPVYSALCSRFTYFLMVRKYSGNDDSSSDISNTTLFSFSWFIFDLIIKSLSLTALENNDTLKGSRENKYDLDFIKYIPKLVSFVVHHFHEAVKANDSRLAVEANNSVALFVRDLFGVFDRGIAMDLAFTYVHKMREGIEESQSPSFITTMLFFKFDFLKIVTDYEHYVNLNVPTPYSIHNIQSLSQKIVDIHPISGLLITEVLSVLTSPVVEVRMVALTTISTLFIKHEYDAKYQARDKRERIAAIYLPLILRLIENYDRFLLWYNVASIDERRLLVGCVLFIMRNLPNTLLRQWFVKEVPQRVNLLFELIEHCVSAFEYHPATRALAQTAPSLPIHITPLVSTPSTNTLGLTPSSSTPDITMSSISKLLKKSHGHKDKGGSLQLPDGAMLPLTQGGSLSQSTSAMLPANTGSSLNLGQQGSSVSLGSSPNGSPTLSHSASQSDVPRALNRSPSISRSRPLSSNEPTLCAEANLIVLDFVEDFVATYTTQLTDPNSPVMEKLFELIMILLKMRQSHRVVRALFASVAAFVAKFRGHFFAVNNNFCGHLCQVLLTYCNSVTRSVRTSATVLFYTLFKLNNQEVGNFGRVKIQATIGLSKLASDGSFSKEGARMLERSLATLSQYSRAEQETTDTSILAPSVLATMTEESVSEAKQRFNAKIQIMSSKLIKIIKDTMRVNMLKASSDPETIHELYSKIASGYSDTPIIRINWLDALADIHVVEENFIEAAICKIRVALLVNAYLEQHDLLPCRLDLSLIQAICPGLAETVIEEDEGVCTSPIFSLEGLTKAVLLAVNYLRMSQCFEFSILLYKLIIPLYEKTRDYVRLSDYYKKSHILYEDILLSNESKSRMLGRYYRVGFYGAGFEDLDGKEFVYKEPKLTHLFALAERLKTFYNEKLKLSISIFPDSSRVDPSNLDPNKLYLQITTLKPYFDSTDTIIRPSYFERHTILNKFVFITPFTLSGRSQGSIVEQFHRKTILSIEGSAPNMLKRYPIVDYKEIEISPIENSIEAIEQRCHLLSLEINQNPPNIKTLQQILQGSVLLQVNAGALEICRGFLAKSQRGNWPAELVDKLGEGCTQFLRLCESALSLNERMIQMNQISFHHELEIGYKKLRFMMDKYVKGEIDERDENAVIDASLEELGGGEDESLTMTEESYDDISIKESNSVFDNITPSLMMIPNFIKDQKKKSGFLTVREDKKSKRESKEMMDRMMAASSSTLETPKSDRSRS